MRAIAGILLFIVVWHVLAIALRTAIVPAPGETLSLLGRLLWSGDIFPPAAQTAWKVMLSLGLAMVVGIPLGILLAMSKPLYDTVRPLLMAAQAIPVISWLSLVIFAWGIGWKGPVFISFLSLLPISVFTTVSGVHNLDKTLLEVAQVYRVPRARVLRDVYLGSLVPFTVAILNVGIGQAWKVVLVTEYLCGGSGIGVGILTARMGVDIPRTWALTLFSALLGIVTERLVKVGLGRISHRWMTA